jgi:DNA-binding beta-propeller fold protein YncE
MPAMSARRQNLVAASAFVLLAAMLPNAALAALAAVQPYRLIQEIQIGGEGFWDYLSIDSAARRLYVAHATHAEVIDLDHNTLVGRIDDTPGIHGVAVAGDIRRLYTSNGREARASIVDATTLKTEARVATGAGPDTILYEPGQQEVYTFNGRGHSVTVFNARSGVVLATIALPGVPEFAVVDAAADRVYANIEDRSSVVAIDTRRHAIVETWPAAPCMGASGLALDAIHQRLFLGCENNMMAMMDSSNGKVLAQVPIGHGVDASAFDPVTQLAFSSCGDGTVTIAHEDSPDILRVVQTLRTAAGARTMSIDPQSHRIYLAVGERTAASAGSAADNFRVLVYGME